MITTTKEQSKRLIELGLDPSTADMWWSNRFVYLSSTPMIGVATEQNQLYTFKWCEMDIPAWSLSALLEVMPITITKDGMEYKLKVFPSGLFSTHSDTSKWTLQYCGRDYSYKSRNKYPILAAITQHDIITAAYEMVCWLLENNLIVKGGQDE